MTVWPLLASLAGAAILVLVAWSRAGRNRAARWWADDGTGTAFDERAVLFILPGFALILLSVWPLAGYSSRTADDAWRLFFAPLVLVGGVMGIWGGMQLYVPRWYLPAWLRARRPRPERGKRS